MKKTVASRIAQSVIASAIGVGAIGYALRAAPVLHGLVSRRTPLAPESVPQGDIAQQAFLVGAPSAAGIARTVSLRLADGRFVGRREYAFYGYVKVQATVQSGRLTNISVLEYPNDNGRSHYINNVALPYLVQEAVDAQSSSVDLISGATFTSEAFVKSLGAALRQAGA
jgi:uncharacterized protein with FMN-binding domain